MSISRLIDKNVQEIDEQYRRYEGLVTVDDIEKMIQVIAHIFEKPEEHRFRRRCSFPVHF